MLSQTKAFGGGPEDSVISNTMKDINHFTADPGALKPFNPGALPFYYGWVILVFASLGIFFSIPGQTMGVSVFTDHLIEALGLTRVRISTAYMLGTFTSSLLMTRAGRLYDRIGARRAAGGAIVFLALFLFFFTRVDLFARGLASLFGGGGQASWISGFILTILGFLGIRFFGQGMLTLVSRTMMMRWFEARRGRVAAWSGIFVSASFAMAPRLYQGLINGQGWRGAWAFLGAGLLLIALPLVLVFFRDTPERCGLEIEQGLRPLGIQKRRFDRIGADASLKEARTDIRYWAYALLLAWWSLYNTAFTFHIIDIFASRGVDAARAVSIFLPITVVTVGTNFLGSWASDAIDLPPLYFMNVLGFMVAGVGILFPGAVWSPWFIIVGLGVAGGLFNVLNNVALPRLFGREHLGEIAGSVMTFLVAGSALGPWLFSVLKTSDGSYFPTGILGLAGPAVLLGLGLVAFSRSRGSDGTGQS